MHFLACQACRPVVILAGLYLAGVWALAESMDPQPWIQVNVNLDEDRRYEFIGLSPDGNAIATHQHLQRYSGGWAQSTASPDTIWVWDLAAISRGTPPTASAHEPPLLPYWRQIEN